MKQLRYWIIIVIAFVAAACYEVNEEVVIGKDGSGTYATRMDMSALVQMIQTMASEEDLAKNGLNRVIDTTISMNSILDSAKDATAEQRRLLGSGTLKMQMNMAENILKADMHFGFKNLEDLQALMSGAATGGMGDILTKVLSARDSAGAGRSVQDQGLQDLNNLYEVKVTRNSISKQLNKARYDSLMQRPEIGQMKQLTASGIEVLYTTTIKLPRAVKKSDNPLIKLSDDKKTVTIKYDLLKVFDNPDTFSYKLEY